MEETFLWTEKYRPRRFGEVKGQKAIVQRVQSLVEKKNVPHLLFAGPAGVGKSTLALVMARELFGEQYKENFLELNASDERGIDVVRVKVKDFARTKALGDVPFKLIFLDECDALTKEAQQALRRTMENYAQTARFVLSCNYVSKIIDPIQSRCVVFKFKPLEKEDIKEIMDMVISTEGLQAEGDILDSLWKVSEGDCRRLQNVLQSCAAVSKTLNEDVIFSTAAIAKPEELKQILETALSGDFHNAKSMLTSTMMKYSLSGLDVIKQLQTEIWGLKMDNRKKVHLIERCGEIEFRLTEGSDEYVQLDSLLASVVSAGL